MNRSSFTAAAHREITVNSRKYDGNVRRNWQAGLVSHTPEMLIAVGRFEFDVDHIDLGHIVAGTVSFEHFWFDRWYNIFRFHEPDGALKAWYCNVAMPATYSDGVLDFIDLDIDVVVWPDLSHAVLDLDDFAENSRKYGYPPEIIKNSEAAVVDILELVRSDGLPGAS